MESKVILFSYDPEMERVCAAAMRSCYSAHTSYDLYSHSSEKANVLEGEKPFDDQRIKSLLRKALELDHMDIFEHGLLTFDLQQVSRACTHQLVRHRLASFSQQCYDVETEILTEHGWVHYDQLGREMRVATLNPDTFEIEYQHPSSIYVYLYDGPMHYFTSKQVDLCVTPNHKLFVKVYGRKRWELLDALDVASIAHGHIEFKKNGIWRGGRNESYLTIPGAHIIKQYASGKSFSQRADIEIRYRDFMQFLGYFLSEGCALESPSPGGWTRYIVEFSQRRGAVADDIESCLRRLPFHAYRSVDKYNCFRWRIEDKSLTKFLKPLGKAHEKFIPRWILERNEKDLHTLFQALIAGDGSIDRKSGWTRYYTTSSRLADDVQELAFKLGYSANISCVKLRDRPNRKPWYGVSIIKGRSTPLVRFDGSTSSMHTVSSYRGAVWCVEVPNHIVYVRRKGKPVWSGNSQRYVRITRTRGYVRPPSIAGEIKVPVQIHGTSHEIGFEDMMDMATQMEEGLLKLGIKPEDARYVRPNAAATNIVTSMNPRQLLHVLTLRCASDAQWEIRDIAWAMFACAKLVAPNIFETLPTAKESSTFQEKITKLDTAVRGARELFAARSKGDLVEILLAEVGLEHSVRAFVRRL